MHAVLKIAIPGDPKQIPSTIHLLRRTLQGRFECYWRRYINSDFSKGKPPRGNKLRTYRTIKHKFKREQYLSLQDPMLRAEMARLRLSAHKLNIETGRYNSKNKYIPPDERLCTCCSMKTCESELHFLIACPAYSDLREKLFTEISLRNPHFSLYNEMEKFTWLMISEDMTDIKGVAHFIQKSMSRRGGLCTK